MKNKILIVALFITALLIYLPLLQAVQYIEIYPGAESQSQTVPVESTKISPEAGASFLPKPKISYSILPGGQSVEINCDFEDKNVFKQKLNEGYKFYVQLDVNGQPVHTANFEKENIVTRVVGLFGIRASTPSFTVSLTEIDKINITCRYFYAKPKEVIIGRKLYIEDVVFKIKTTTPTTQLTDAEKIKKEYDEIIKELKEAARMLKKNYPTKYNNLKHKIDDLIKKLEEEKKKNIKAASGTTLSGGAH